MVAAAERPCGPGPANSNRMSVGIQASGTAPFPANALWKFPDSVSEKRLRKRFDDPTNSLNDKKPLDGYSRKGCGPARRRNLFSLWSVGRV
jgi:hypothetical protein